MKRTVDQLTNLVIGEAIAIHREIGPGLLESVYEKVLAESLRRQKLHVRCQYPIGIEVRGMQFPDAFKIDILVERTLILEIKSVERLSRAHAKQLLTYLRLTNQPVGLLMNFSEATMREGIKRLVNAHKPDD